MHKGTVYLAGPMSGLTFRQALEWRYRAIQALNSSWNIINPVQVQVSLDKLDDTIICPTQEDENLPLHLTATGITAQDEFFIDSSNWLLCNFLNAKIISIGTIWEIGYAWGTRKKIISVVKQGSIHDHPFVRRRSHLFTEDFEEALSYLKAIAI